MSTSPALTEGRFAVAIALARLTFAQLDKRGMKWKTRHVPLYIRASLWKPYYLTETVSGESELYIIQAPNAQNDKVHFARWVPPS